MTLTYLHYYRTVAPLLDEIISLFGSAEVVSGSSTVVRIAYVDAAGDAAIADLTGTGLTFAGGALTGGTVDGVTFLDAQGVLIGQVTGFGLTAAAFGALGADSGAAADFLMGEDWNTHYSHYWQQDSDLPRGTELADGTRFDMQGDDYFSLGFNADRFFSGAGNDILYGRNGNDTLDGGNGNDTVKGHHNDDLLLGGTGDDYLFGGSGRDRLKGGAGADQFAYETDFGDSGLSLGGLDTVVDFDLAEDLIRIELSAVGVTDMSAVSIRDAGDHALVRIAYSSGGEDFVQKVKLLDVDHTLVAADHFLFL